jgi:hypothetical protein
MYDDNRYEVEEKYTQFVDLNSRPVWPRLDMHPLAALLNKLEQCHDSLNTIDSSSQQHDQDAYRSGGAAAAAAAAAGAGEEGSQGLVWVANSMINPGELLSAVVCCCCCCGVTSTAMASVAPFL